MSASQHWTVGGAGPPVAAQRPRARGWIHLWSAVAAVGGGVALLLRAAHAPNVAISLGCAVYATTLTGMFSISATYHRVIWRAPRARSRMRQIDHSVIFLFIAGTFTAVCVLSTSSAEQSSMLGIVWLGALCGILAKARFLDTPGWGVPSYLLLGAAGLWAVPSIGAVSGPAVVLFCLGQALYFVGAILFALRYPRGWPDTFGFHEFFHSLVSTAALSQFVAIWLLAGNVT